MSEDFLRSPLDLTGKKIWVAGHNGMVGGAVVRALNAHNCEILTASKADLDLRRQSEVETWMTQNEPDMIILAAAKVGGIGANAEYPADFLYDNMMIEANVIHAAYRMNVEKLLFVGSSCIYPKFAEQPINENALLSGALEPSNQWYALAKIVGVKLCEAYRAQYGCDFISAMPCNLYGIGDRYDALQSHVIPAMIMKLHEAKMTKQKQVTFWGTGMPLREFLYIDDLAAGLVHLLQNYNGAQTINIGSGKEITMRDLAMKIAAIVGYDGDIDFNPSKTDGTPRKVLDNTKINENGWCSSTSLEAGLKRAYKDFLSRLDYKYAA